MIAFYHLCSSFKIVKWLFKFLVDGQNFDFSKLFQYGILPQPPRGLLYIFFDVIKSIEDRFGKNHKYYKMI